MFIFNPKKVPNPPKSAQELLAWAKANPGKFFYARPANSGPGMSIIVGLPYILGDKDPQDPENGWDKTWAFLKELGQYIEYYPTGTAVHAARVRAGAALDDRRHHGMGHEAARRERSCRRSRRSPSWRTRRSSIDGHYWAIPKGVPQNEIDIILDLMKFMLQPEQQALTWKGFIGPVNQEGDDRQGAAGYPGLCQGVLASRIRRDGQEIEDRADARREASSTTRSTAGTGSRRAEDQAPVQPDDSRTRCASGSPSASAARSC